MQYGNAVHTVLKRYYDSVLAGQPLSPQQVEEEFRREFAKAALDDSHQRELYERQGIAQLRDFLAARASEPPLEVLDTEKTFSVEIGGARLRGRVDRLDRCGEDGVAIVDYKTGAPRSQEDADESLQLSIYALAAQRQ